MEVILLLPLAPIVLAAIGIWVWMLWRFLFRAQKEFRLGALALCAMAGEAVALAFFLVSGTLVPHSAAFDYGILGAWGGAALAVPAYLLLVRLTANAGARVRILSAFGGGLVSAGVAMGLLLGLMWPDSDVVMVLRAGRLAPLPARAHEVKVHKIRNLFAPAGYLSFRAEPADIETFLANSPSIEGVRVTIYSPEHMRLPYTKDFREEDGRHEYYSPGEREWFNATIEVKGRKYVIPPDDGGHNWGEIIIDDETGTVYVEVDWS